MKQLASRETINRKKEKPKIKALLDDEQPYEKLEKNGPSFLSLVELLAIIIRTGTTDTSSLGLARQVIDLRQNGLIGCQQLTLRELQTIKGIGRVKAIQLQAVMELTKRLAKEKAFPYFQINSPTSIANLYMEEMRYHKQEHFKAVLLNTKNQIIHEKDLFIGTVNAALVEPREILIYALTYEAVSLIMLHNHPSGDPTPSLEDIHVTKRCQQACRLLGINLLDHIVIGNGRYISLKEKGYIK